MIKRFLGILLCLCSILLMSHNVFAADINQTNVSFYNNYTNTAYRCPWNSSTWYYGNTCHLGASTEVPTVYMAVPNTSIAPGEYFVEIYLEITGSGSYGAPLWLGADSGINMDFVSQEMISSTTRSDFTFRVYRLLYHWTGGTDLSVPFAINNGNGIFNSEGYRINSSVFWRVNAAGSTIADVVSAINSQSSILRSIDTNIVYGVNHLQNIEDYLDDIRQNMPTADDIADEEEDRVQDSSDQAQQDADQAQQDAQQSTSSLLGVGSTIVSTIVNQPATNCLIDMTFAHYTVGNVNLCANVPSAILSLIQGLASLVIVPIIAMYALYLLNKLIGLLRGFTG